MGTIFHSNNHFRPPLLFFFGIMCMLERPWERERSFVLFVRVGIRVSIGLLYFCAPLFFILVDISTSLCCPFSSNSLYGLSFVWRQDYGEIIAKTKKMKLSLQELVCCWLITKMGMVLCTIEKKTTISLRKVQCGVASRALGGSWVWSNQKLVWSYSIDAQCIM